MLKTLAIFILMMSSAHAADYNAVADRATKLLKNLVETKSVGANEDKVVAILKKRFDSAGIPYEVSEFAKNRLNIVARLKGNGSQKPLLILSHSDVVSTERQTWETPPHQLVDKEGYIYGRGVVDDLGYVAIVTELLIEIKNDKTVLDRDLIFAVTGDEEKGGEGIKYLIANHRKSIDAEFALNEGGAVITDESGAPTFVGVASAEKIYQDFKIIAKGTAGHSSVPRDDNAIYALSNALAKLGKHKEPIKILSGIASYFKGKAQIEKDPAMKAAFLAVAKNPKNPPKKSLAILEKDPAINAVMRNTCVATVVQGGAINAKNVLPAVAEAYVNCRILPGQKVEDIKAKLISIFDDPKITIELDALFGESDESTLDSPVIKAAQKITKEMLNDIPLVPTMQTGATDSRYVRATGIPSYGIAPFYISALDRMRAHGANERLLKKSMPASIEFYHRLVLEIIAKK